MDLTTANAMALAVTYQRKCVADAQVNSSPSSPPSLATNGENVEIEKASKYCQNLLFAVLEKLECRKLAKQEKKKAHCTIVISPRTSWDYYCE